MALESLTHSEERPVLRKWSLKVYFFGESCVSISSFQEMAGALLLQVKRKELR